MGTLDIDLLLQGSAAITWAAAGASCLRAARDTGHPRRLLGFGLLIGAALQAIDTFTVPADGLPLAGLALTVFAGLVALGARLGGLTVAAVVAATVFGLHWAHGASPRQPVFTWPVAWHPLDLTVAIALGWVAWRGRDQQSRSADLGRLAAVTAAGLGVASFGGRFAEQITAISMCAAALPLLVDSLRHQTVACCTALATTFAVALTCALRAVVLTRGDALHLAGMDDPLLVLAVLQAALGSALWRAQTATDGSVTPTAPVAAPIVASGPPATPRADAPPPNAQLVPATIVRELRTPLTNLVTAVDLAVASDDRKAMARLSDQLQAYAHHMTAAMTDIAELEHLLRGEFELAEDVFDLPRLVGNCITEVSPLAAEKALEVRLDIANSTPRWVQGDPARTRQLITRTMQLAVLGATIGPVDVSVSADDDSLHIVLLNEHTTNTSSDGLGSLFATELVRAMGGRLDQRQRAGGGVQLHLTLPKQVPPDWEIELIEQDEEASQPRSESAQPLSGTVLLITDNTDHRALLARLLGSFGAEVVTADSGTLGKHLFSGTPCDLVLIDMQLHNEDALTLVRGMRAEGNETPVLALSSDCSTAELERILGAGCNGHIEKPVDADMLRRTLALHLVAAD